MGEFRHSPVYHALGGGTVADVLLWKKWCSSISLLVCSTSLWFLFEHAGYNILTLIANVLLLVVSILFLWAKSASLLNRPLPPLPDLEVSEESVLKAADVLRVWINYILSIAREISIDGNLKLFVLIASGLWVVSYLGSFFNFLTLLYIGILLSLSVPLFYEKYQNEIDKKLIVTRNVIQTQYRKVDEQILSKIPRNLSKEKKAQ